MSNQSQLPKRSLRSYRPQHDEECPVAARGMVGNCSCGLNQTLAALDTLLARLQQLEEEIERLRESITAANAVCADIRSIAWEVIDRRDGDDRSLVGLVLLMKAQLEEARDNRRGEYELRVAAEARLQQGEKAQQQVTVLQDMNARLQMKMSLNADEALAEQSRLKSRIAWLEGTAMPHARKQEHANGFQVGWRGALTRIEQGDSVAELRELVPQSAAAAPLPQRAEEQ